MNNEQTPRKKKKRKKKHYLLRLILLVMIITGVYFFLSSAIFDVQKITVENNSYYTGEQIIERAAAKNGVNLFFETDIKKMKKRLQTDPYIKNVQIQRRLPGTIKIMVEERQEAAAIPYAETYILIDSGGMVLRKTETEPKLTLLLGLTIKKMNIGAPLEVEENSVLTDTLKMLETMENSDLFFKKIDISNVLIKAYIYDQLICQGTPENIMASMDSGALELVLYEQYAQGIERGVINVGSDNYCSFNPMVE